jgi:hypothetical protein
MKRESVILFHVSRFLLQSLISFSKSKQRSDMAIKVGIFGFAHGHVNAYCNQWRDNPGMDISVVAAWDHDAARLEQNAKTYGLRTYADKGAFLNDPDVQAVIIAAETSLHAELVELAAAAGKPIVVQKPMALTMPQADRIVAAVNQYGAECGDQGIAQERQTGPDIHGAPPAWAGHASMAGFHHAMA